MNIGDVDQAIAGLKDFASISYSYYASLIMAGFNDTQATQMVIEWQKSLLNKQ